MGLGVVSSWTLSGTGTRQMHLCPVKHRRQSGRRRDIVRQNLRLVALIVVMKSRTHGRPCRVKKVLNAEAVAVTCGGLPKQMPQAAIPTVVATATWVITLLAMT